MDQFTFVIVLMAPSFLLIQLVIHSLKCCKIKTARDTSFDYNGYDDNDNDEETTPTQENEETGQSELTLVVEDADEKSDEELPRYNELFK